MATAFICYARDNKVYAEQLSAKLHQKKFKAWWDEGELRAGTIWKRAIDNGLASSDIILIVMTPEANSSPYVTYEWAYALGLGKPVIPLLFVKTDMHPRLEELQYLDFRKPNSRTWIKLYNEIKGLETKENPEARLTKKLEITETREDVFKYVFNRLNPYHDVLLTKDFLINLPANRGFQEIDDVLDPLELLVHHYISQLIKPWMRIYFAYAIVKPTKVSRMHNQTHADDFTAYYRLGISFCEEDDKWYEGLPVGQPSNIHNTYRRKKLTKIRDATQNILTRSRENEKVTNEGSVAAIPVLFSDDSGLSESIGVIGISSPNKREVTVSIYQKLIQETSVLFSALFYAYGRFLLRTKTYDKVVERLRKEIDEYFEDRLGPLN